MIVFLLFDAEGPDRRDAGSALAAWAAARGHKLSVACASDRAIKPCLGCFGCWLKTPGTCVVAGDGGDELLESFVRADLVVLAGATPYGCFAVPIKAVLDRWLPSLLPYFRRFRGEMHHVPRYAQLPRIVSAGIGEASEAEEATHLELVRAFCDNAASPRQKRAFRYRGDAAELASWLDGELAS